MEISRSQQLPELLILGGSQGASAINRAMMAAIPRLKRHLENWHIVHQTGAAELEEVRANYARHGVAASVSAFLSPMVEVYARAGLVVSRAGATTLAELACCGIPAIVIPYPQAVNQHQLRNAEHYRDNAAAILIEQSERSHELPERLANELVSLLSNGDRRAQMSQAMRRLAHTNAAEAVADCVLRVVNYRSGGLPENVKSNL